MKNSLEKGSVRYIVFREPQEPDTWYAVGLEFNIVETGTTPQEALLLLFEALEGYVETARKIKMRPHVLNQRPNMEYEQLWANVHNKNQKLHIPQSRSAEKEVFTVGQLALA